MSSVAIWCAPVVCDQIAPHYFVCADRLAYLETIHHPDARAAALTGDLLLRRALCPNGILSRKQRPGGQPYLADYPNLHISISHSGKFVICAIGDIPVGIDIEFPRPIRSNLAARWFSQQEQALVKHNANIFFDLWMAREAVLKEIGCGLSGLHLVHTAYAPLRLITPILGQMHTFTILTLPYGARAVLSTPGLDRPDIHLYLPAKLF